MLICCKEPIGFAPLMGLLLPNCIDIFSGLNCPALANGSNAFEIIPVPNLLIPPGNVNMSFTVLSIT